MATHTSVLFWCTKLHHCSDSNHEQNLNRSIIVNEYVYIGCLQQHSLQTTVFCLVYCFLNHAASINCTAHHICTVDICSQTSQPCTVILSQEIERKQPIYAAAILSFNIHWLDLHKAVDKRRVLGLWPHPISIWQLEVAVTMLHVYSRLTFIMARRLSCIIVPCRMQIFTWMAVITERRSSRREAWGVLFIARYSEGNECHTLVTVINDGQPSSSQLQRHLSAPSCSRSKPNGKGRAAEEELCARVFRGIPLTSPVLFQSYQCLPTMKCSLNSEWSAICFRSFW